VIDIPKICLGQDGFVNLGQTEDTTTDNILSFAEGEGFQGIELHNQYQPYELKDAAAVRKSYLDRGLEIPGLQTGHLTYFNRPISENQDERKQYVADVDEALVFDQAIGGVHSTLTPPVMIGDFTPTEYDAAMARYVETIEEVAAVAEKRGIVMAVEPEPNLIMNGGRIREPIEDVKHLLNSVKSKNLCVLFDVCHVNVLSHGDPVGFLKKLKGRVSWVHVADNDLSLTPTVGTASHLEFGKGNVDLKKLMSAFKEEVPRLKWLQIDTWENPLPYETARKNKTELARVLNEISWR
jgi:sugar phosphate isomerase/epimerase